MPPSMSNYFLPDAVCILIRRLSRRLKANIPSLYLIEIRQERFGHWEGNERKGYGLTHIREAW